jgi:hypothetical protein
MEPEDSNYTDCAYLNDSDDASIYTIDYKIGEDGSDCLLLPIDENVFMNEDIDSEEENCFHNSSYGFLTYSLYYILSKIISC